MAKLTHTDLLKFGQRLGYLLNSDGLCKGFSGMLMQAILAQDEDSFWKRLKLIEEYQSDFLFLIKKIDEVRFNVTAKQQGLSEQDMELLEILAFYEEIELYLESNNHPDVFGNRFVSQFHLNEIYSLTRSTKLENSNLTIILNKAYAFNQNGLMNYINDLKSVVSNYPDLPVLIGSSNHSVLLKYNAQNSEKPWIYVDTNDFAAYPECTNYYRELPIEELVHF